MAHKSNPLQEGLDRKVPVEVEEEAGPAPAAQDAAKIAEVAAHRSLLSLAAL
jgi:hypothetical protein